MKYSCKIWTMLNWRFDSRASNKREEKYKAMILTPEYIWSIGTLHIPVWRTLQINTLIVSFVCGISFLRHIVSISLNVSLVLCSP